MQLQLCMQSSLLLLLLMVGTTGNVAGATGGTAADASTTAGVEASGTQLHGDPTHYMQSMCQ